MRRLLALAALIACHRAPTVRGRDGLVIGAEWPGASAEDLEQQVALPIERILAGAPHVVHVRTRAIPGRVTIALEIETGIDPFVVSDEIRGRLENISVQLPGAMPPPFVTRAPGSIVLRYTVTSGTLPLAQVTSANDDLVRALYTIPGVADAETCGDQRARVTVSIDPAALAASGLTVADITAALAKADSQTATSGGAFIVRRPQLDRDTANKTIVAQRNDVPIRIGEVAAVVDGSDPSECVAFDNGRRVLAVAVRAQPNVNVLELREKLEQRLASAHSPGLELAVLPRDKPLLFSIDSGAQSIEKAMDSAERATEMLARLPQVARVIVETEAGTLRFVVFEHDGDARTAVTRALPDAHEVGELVVQLFGDDPDQLGSFAQALAKAIGGDVVGGRCVMTLHLEIDRHAAARYELDAHDIEKAYAIATNGVELGGVRVEMRTPDPQRALDTLIPTHIGVTVPLRDVATLREVSEPIEIRREDGRRWVGVRTRADAAAARDAIAKLALPQGYEARLATGEP